jgi:hypothetical protein
MGLFMRLEPDARGKTHEHGVALHDRALTTTKWQA